MHTPETPPKPPGGLFDLTDHVAIVTGASSGLGHRFARVLHVAGAHVVAVARRADRIDALAGAHERISPYTADVTDDDAMRALVADTQERFGRIDVLVNNAGLGTPEPAVDEPLESFRYTMEVNLVSVFNLARLAAGIMLEQGGGSVVNVASVYGLRSSWPIPNGGYTASKGGVVQLTRELACHWAKNGVRVNSLVPGFFDTEGTAGMVDDPQGRAYVERGAPMRRFGQAHELDGALLYLASRASTYMTGQNLIVDGGWTAH